MKRIYGMLFLIAFLGFIPQKSHAQLAIAEIIKAGVKKIIIAADLKVQRLQNETIWLQNAQKVLENSMSKLKLNEISDWTERQKNLYQDYYEELQKVKSIVVYYHRVKEITAKEAKLVDAYQKAWSLFNQDKNFSIDELAYMAKVYDGILGESIQNIDQIALVVQSFQTQMSDAGRLAIIRDVAEQIDRNYRDLLIFNQQNIQLSLSRTQSIQEAKKVRMFYGLP